MALAKHGKTMDSIKSYDLWDLRDLGATGGGVLIPEPKAAELQPKVSISKHQTIKHPRS